MTLHAIVAALGGDLYSGGSRANVPAPGHSPSDRSVSLLLSGDRVIIHSFGSVSWTAVRDQLHAAGHIDRQGRLTTCDRPAGAWTRDPAPDRSTRMVLARRLWAEARPITRASLSHRHLVRRAIRTDPALVEGLRHHRAAPVSVHQPAGRRGPALIAAISTPEGELTAVEITYLDPGGARDRRLRLSRKMLGLVPSGSAVRLAPQASHMVVGEGVMSVLSASERFGLPAWALLSARNLAAWSPPLATRQVVVASDRGAPGETAAAVLVRRLRAAGVEATLAPPPGDAEDWNAWAMRQRGKEGG